MLTGEPESIIIGTFLEPKIVYISGTLLEIYKGVVISVCAVF